MHLLIIDGGSLGACIWWMRISAAEEKWWLAMTQHMIGNSIQ